MHRILSPLLIAAGMGATTAAADTIRVLNWSDYIVPGTIEAFEAETGHRVVYDNYRSGEVVERQLLAGGSGYDVVVVSSEYLGRLIAAGALRPYEGTGAGHAEELSEILMERLALFDPGNRHAIPYLWGTTGIGYDADAIRARDPDAPLDDWSLIFDPEIVAQFADCGVGVVDSPEEMLAVALIHLGHDPNSTDPAAIEEATAALAAIAPFVSRFDSEQIWDLVSGGLCLAVAWSTDVLHAADLSDGARDIRYSVPSAGASLWYDVFVMPADGDNPDAGQAFVDFMTRAENLAAASEFLWAANASDAAWALMSEELRTDPMVHPTPEVMASLAPVVGHTLEGKRRFAMVWAQIKLGF